MKNTEWPVERVQEVARQSGRPLEIEAALAFLGGGWRVEVGSYFSDGALDELRELDVFATKEAIVPDNGLRVRFRATVSCKGFRVDTSPLTYSITRNAGPEIGRRLLSQHRGRSGSGILPEYEENAGKLVLRAAGMLESRPIIAFDLVQRRQEGKAPKVREVFERRGDRDLFEGLDSALKGSLSWRRIDGKSADFFAALYLPVLVTALPFWDVCIDRGQVGTPELLECGYHSARMQSQDGTVSALTLICTPARLPALVETLDGVFDWFHGRIVEREAEIRR